MAAPSNAEILRRASPTQDDVLLDSSSNPNLDQPQRGVECVLRIFAVNPMHVALRAQPGHLPLRVGARAAARLRDGLLQRALARHDRNGLGVADRAERPCLARVAREELPRL